jgi:hypothetical protein
MSSGPSIGLFAALARKALQATAIRPRLPSRYEGSAAEAFNATAWTTQSDVHGAQEAREAPATAPQRSPGQARATPPGARPPTVGERAPADLETGAAQNDPGPAHAPQRAAPASVLAEPVQAPAARSSAARRATASLPPSAEASVGRPSPADVGLPALGAAVSTMAPAVASTAGFSEPPPRPTARADAATGSAQVLRARIAEQVARLQDGPAAPSPALLHAGEAAPAAAAAPLNAGPNAPRVDITIGSIAIVLTPAPAATVARVAPPAAGPAVQSLDAYLLARQRRGVR